MTIEHVTEKPESKTEDFRRYLDFVGAFIVMLDEKGIVTYVNKKGCEILGFDEKDIAGKNWIDKFLPDDVAGIIEKMRKKVIASKPGERVNYENPVVTKSGEIRLIAWSNIVLRDDEDRIIGTLSSGDDITDIKIYEQQLQQNQLQLARAEEIAEVGNWILDIKTNKYTYSDGFYKICGIDLEKNNSYFGNVRSVTHPEDRKRIEKIIAESIEAGADYEFVRRDRLFV